MPDVELFFDPVCPYCWQTSKWLRQVQRRNGMEIGYRFISLRFLNEPSGYEGKPATHRQIHRNGTRLLRVAAATRDAHGNDAVGTLYRCMGEALWEIDAPGNGGRDAIRQLHASEPDIAAMLAAASLPAGLVRAADDEAADEVIRDETSEALRRAGSGVGTPILSFSPPDGPAFFGPVISDLPDDDGAVATFEAVALLARWPGFAELKRSLRTFPDVRIGRQIRAERETAGARR